MVEKNNVDLEKSLHLRKKLLLGIQHEIEKLKEKESAFEGVKKLVRYVKNIVSLDSLILDDWYNKAYKRKKEMTRAEFAGLFLGFIVKKIPMWLPEEATEEHMLDVMQQRMKEHNLDIKEVLTSDRRAGDRRCSNNEH